MTCPRDERTSIDIDSGAEAKGGADASSPRRIEAAVASLGEGPLSAAGLADHVRPLFSRVLAASGQRVYLANHSLGRPLDATASDVGEALTAWYARMGDAWDDWLAELGAFRARLARLLGAARPDSVIPKTSAGQGLRAVLHTVDQPIRVVATRGEFDSIDVILRHYAQRQRIALDLVGRRDDGVLDTGELVAAIDRGCDLLVVSQVMFDTGQLLDDLPALVAHAHRRGARVLVDVYHSLGVIPIDVQALDADYAIGGSYKYLRGGPGACFLYVHPRRLDEGLQTLDIGWFAKHEPFAYRRPDPPELAAGGDRFLESTPPVLPYYQARAGQLLTLALGPARVRAYSVALQASLCERLAVLGLHSSDTEKARGAFVAIAHSRAGVLSDRLRARGVVTDARGRWLRLCPDILTTPDEIELAVQVLAEVMRDGA